MLRNEIEKKTGLTRKAINYYERKGLIGPRKDENGYRVYSEDDLNSLKKISILRKLGIPVSDIKDLLLNNKNGLSSLLRKNELNLEKETKKNEILEDLIRGEDRDLIERKLKVLENSETIYEKLERAFLGYIGQMIFTSYRPFLNEPVDDKEAFKDYVAYLDDLPEFDLSKDEISYIENLSSAFDMDDLDDINDKKIEAVSDVETWANNNEEMIKAYEDFKNSNAYKNSPALKINDRLKSYMLENDYYKIAIPLIRKFSKSYDDYYKKLLEADKVYREMADKN